MKNTVKLLCCLMTLIMMAVTVFVPMSVSAADYAAPSGTAFISDITAGRILVDIAPGTTVSDLAATFSGYTIAVKNASGAAVASDAKIGTGCTVTVTSNGTVVDTFSTIVYGDVNCDGVIDISDSVIITQAVLGNSKLNRINFLAADISLNSKNDASDLLNMSMHILGMNNIDQAASSATKTLGEAVRIVTIGDSITEGLGTFNSYRTQLAKNLYNAGANVEFVGPNTSVDPRVSTTYSKHAGWSGYFSGPSDIADARENSIYHMLPTIFPYDSEGNTQDIADIGLMMIGHNNYFRNVALNDENGNHVFGEEYKTLVRAIFERQPNLTLYCATMINQDNGYSPDYNYKDKYNFSYEESLNNKLDEWVADLVAEGYDVRYFDLCTATNMSAAAGDFDSDDGTHPNEQGQAKMGDAWFERIVDDVLARNEANPTSAVETKVQSIQLDKSEISIFEGYHTSVTATVSPANADFGTVVWTSSNKAIATVDTFGNVTGVSPGVTTVSATSLSGKMSAICKVTVTADATKSEMPTNVFSSTFRLSDIDKFTSDSKTNMFNQENRGEIYLSSQNCWLETAKAYDLGNNWSATVTQQSTINFNSNWGHAIELTVGNLKARIIDCNKKYEIVYNGNVIASTTSIYEIDTCTFTLRYNKGKVYLIKENHVTGAKRVMLEADVPNENYYSTYSIYNTEQWRACVMTRCSLNKIK